MVDVVIVVDVVNVELPQLCSHFLKCHLYAKSLGKWFMGSHRAWGVHSAGCPRSSLCPTVHLEGFCGGTRFDCKDVKFVVGEGEDHDIPIGIDKALEKMQRGEHCILYLGPR